MALVWLINSVLCVNVIRTFRTEPKLFASNGSICFIPPIVAYSSPASSDADLHTSLAAVSSNQAKSTMLTRSIIDWRERERNACSDFEVHNCHKWVCWIVSLQSFKCDTGICKLSVSMCCRISKGNYSSIHSVNSHSHPRLQSNSTAFTNAQDSGIFKV